MKKNQDSRSRTAVRVYSLTEKGKQLAPLATKFLVDLEKITGIDKQKKESESKK